jgi:hypothetical protein
MRKYKKAYILSSVDGVVQIGNTVFHVATGQKFNVTMRGVRRLPFVWVNDKSFKSAKEALIKYNSKEK